MVNEEAEEWKKKGNDAFKERNWEEAIKHYNKAITLDPENASYYSNRSAAWASKGNHDSALADANRCLSHDPNFAKGYSRKGKALFDLNKWEEAEAAYKEGLAKDPGNDACTRGLADLASKRAQRRSAPRSAGGSGGSSGGAGDFLSRVMERFKKGGKMQTYMMVMFAYFAFQALTGRGKAAKSKDSVPDPISEDDDSTSATGAQASRRFKELNGMWVSYLETDSKSDTLLLLLHRTSLSAEVEYGAAIPRLSDVAAPSGNFRLLAPDRPCHGFSPCPSGGESMDPTKWLSRLVRLGGAPDKLTIVAAGREAALQAFTLAGRQSEVMHILLIAPKAVAPAREKLASAKDVSAWLGKQDGISSAQAAADAAYWAAGELPDEGQAGKVSLSVEKLSQDLRVTILYGDHDEEDEELRSALEAHGVEVKTRSTVGDEALHDILADETQQALNPDAVGVERSEE